MPTPEPTHLYSHYAMATRFSIRIHHSDKIYAARFAQAIFEQIDALENTLSRFVEHSEVSRFNRWPPEKPFFVSDEVFRCIELAESVRVLSGGAFDICLRQGFPANPSDQPRVVLDHSSQAITRTHEFVKVDLGGIGKGMAMESIRGIADEWEIADWIAHGGFSSVLAMGSANEDQQGWPVRLAGNTTRTLYLVDQAIGASGTEEKGTHIFDPRSGKAETLHSRIWVVGPNAAIADALSTAFMLLDEATIRNMLEHYASYACIIDSPAIHAADPSILRSREIDIDHSLHLA